jgi:hypothetical protein
MNPGNTFTDGPVGFSVILGKVFQMSFLFHVIESGLVKSYQFLICPEGIFLIFLTQSTVLDFFLYGVNLSRNHASVALDFLFKEQVFQVLFLCCLILILTINLLKNISQ